MAPILYVYKKCSTCQKAIRFLLDRNIQVEEREITRTPPTHDELQRMLDFFHGDWKKIFNTSGMLYREMQLAKKLECMTRDEAFSLLSQNGMLIKRPFLLTDTFGLLGFHESKWSLHFQIP